MIDKKDLRIGNYIMYDNRYFQIYSISDEFPTLNTIEFGIGVVDWNNISPIPITEELLVKCGFEQDDELDYRFRLGIKHDPDFITYDLDDNMYSIHDSWINTTIKSLHQLQNLYYALTKQELTIEI